MLKSKQHMPNVYLKFLQNIAALEPIQLKHKDLITRRGKTLVSDPGDSLG